MKTETNINSYISLPCKKCNRIVDNVGESAKSVICSICTLGMVGFPAEPKSAYTPTGRPAGWHWMAEFVDKDGNFYEDESVIIHIDCYYEYTYNPFEAVEQAIIEGKKSY